MLCVIFLIPMVSIIFMQMKHPLSMSVVLLVQTTLVSLVSGSISFNLWFSYILFLIMVGGMLVLFIYMTSVASNEKFSFKVSDLILPSMGLTLILVAMLTMDMNNVSSLTKTDSMNILLTKYLNYPMNTVIISMMIYLLIALIAVVNISNIKYGPLRQKF